MEINMWKKYSYFVLLTYLLVGFWLWPQVGVIALVCMVAPIVLAFKYGRKWCGSYCPRGSLWDNVFTKINDNSKQDDLIALLIANKRKSEENIAKWILQSGSLPSECIKDFERVFISGLSEVEVFLRSEGVI